TDSAACALRRRHKRRAATPAGPLPVALERPGGLTGRKVLSGCWRAGERRSLLLVVEGQVALQPDVGERPSEGRDPERDGVVDEHRGGGVGAGQSVGGEGAD